MPEITRFFCCAKISCELFGDVEGRKIRALLGREVDLFSFYRVEISQQRLFMGGEEEEEEACSLCHNEERRGGGFLIQIVIIVREVTLEAENTLNSPSFSVVSSSLI